MQNQNLEKCILELKKNQKDRNETIIKEYLKSLTSLFISIKEKIEDSDKLYNNLAKIMAYQKYNKDEIIFQYGEKVNDIYLILNGNVNVLSPKFLEYYMNEEQFIFYLLKLRKNNQDELANQCIKYNAAHFSYTNDFISDLVFNLEKNELKILSLIKNKKIFKEVKGIINYLKIKEKIKIKNKFDNMTLEKLISLTDIDEEIKIYTEKIKMNKIIYNLQEIPGKRRLVKLPTYEQISLLKEGDIFGDNLIEYSKNKVNETAIAATDCDLVKINKTNYKDLMKESLAKRKNSFFNLIFTYQIFENVPYGNLDKRYYDYFRYVKCFKNQLLFKEGDICDNIFFISKGEYEIFFEKNILEVNNIILRLKNIIDELKKFILFERKKILNKSISKQKIYLKLKNNLNQFFKKFESEINLDEIAFNIKFKEINTEQQIIENQKEKLFLSKRRIKLGIFKTRQIIGLNDIINRDEGNICLFNCKCSSFEGELYYVPYNKFLSLCETEDKVNLYTSELLFQNIYYIIERLVSYKKFIIDNQIRKENDIQSKLSDEKERSIKAKNKIIKKTNNNFLNILKNIKIEDISNSNINKYNKNISPISDMKFKKILNYFSKNPNSSKNLFRKKERMEIKKNMISNILSEQKENSKIESNDENNVNKNLSENDLMSSKNKNDNNFKYIKINNNNNFTSRNLSPSEELKHEKTQTRGKNTINKNIYLKIPMLVINDKIVQIKDDYEEINNFDNKTNYENFIKYVTNNSNNNMDNLVNNNELKNIILFGDYREKIEKKLKLKLIKKTKDIILRKYKTKNFEKNTEKIFDNNSYNFQITPLNNVSQSLNSFNINTYRKINDCRKIAKKTIKIKGNSNNKKFNKQNQILDNKINLDSKNLTFNTGKNEINCTKNVFFKNSSLKKNLSGFPFVNETNDNNKNFEKDNIRTKLYHIKTNKNRFLKTPKTPKSLMNSFNIFKRKMEKLNIILK